MPVVEQIEREKFKKNLQIGTGMVDVGNDTLFGLGENNLREPRTDRLTLVISSGGSGIQAIHSALTVANQKLRNDFRTYVKFVAIDADPDAFANLDGMDVTTYDLKDAAASARFEDGKRDSFFRNFMPKEYDASVLTTDGAGQQRMAGKIRLYDRVRGASNALRLRELIQGFFATGDWKTYQNMEVDILLIAGLAGGTGSGTFMDLAVIARNACLNPARVKVYAYLLLPDTAIGAEESDTNRLTKYSNGFAALKELESYMSIDYDRGRKELFKSPIEAHNAEITSLKKVIDFPILVSGSREQAVSIIAEAIVDTIAWSNGFSQFSFYSNMGAAKTNAGTALLDSGLGKLRQGACPEDSRAYGGIGFAQALIPEKIIIPNIVGKVCRRFFDPSAVKSLADIEDKATFCSKTKFLNLADFEKQIKVLLGINEKQEVGKESLWAIVQGLMRTACMLPDNEVQLTIHQLRNGQTEEYLKGFKIESTTTHGLEELKKSLGKMYSNFSENAKTVMKQYGPRAIEYLFDGTGAPNAQGRRDNFDDICLRNQLEVVRTKLTKISQKTGSYPGSIDPGLLDSIFGRAKDNWIGDAKKAAQTDVYQRVAERLVGNGQNGVWVLKVDKPVTEFKDCCVRFADVLETLTDFYTGQGRDLDETDFKKFASATGSINTINLCDTDKLFHWVKDTVNAKVEEITANLSVHKAKLIDDFMNHSKEWISNEPGKARRQYDQVMSEICQLGIYANNPLPLQMANYFEKLVEGVPETEQAAVINQAVDGLMERLKTASRPSLRKVHDEHETINTIVLYPEALTRGGNAGIIDAAFMRHAHEPNGRGVYPTSVVDSIVCYQTSVANAVSDLEDLTLWEDAYEAVGVRSMETGPVHLHNGELISLHLKTGYAQYRELKKSETDKEMELHEKWLSSEEEEKLFGTGLSWVHYPSINMRRYENDFFQNLNTSEAKYRREVFGPKVKFAIKEGFVEWERDPQNPNCYKYFINLIPADWENLGIKGYRVRKDGLLKRGRELFEFWKEQNRESRFREYRHQIMLAGSQVFGEAGFDFSQVIQREHWSQERMDRTHQEYMMRILRKNTGLYQSLEDTLYRYQECYEILREDDIEVGRKQRASLFSDLLLNGVIQTDNEGYEWTVQTNRRGALENLITFGRKTTMHFEGFEKKLWHDGFRLYLVYLKFIDKLDSKALDPKALSEVKHSIIDALSEKELDQMIDANLDLMQAGYDRYKDKFGEVKDPVGEIMDQYEMDDDQIKEAEKMQNFYDSLIEIISQNRN